MGRLPHYTWSPISLTLVSFGLVFRRIPVHGQLCGLRLVGNVPALGRIGALSVESAGEARCRSRRAGAEIALGRSHHAFVPIFGDDRGPVTGHVHGSRGLSGRGWTTAASLGGYITLTEANTVPVPQLSESLCVLLTGASSVDTSNPNEKTCKKDAGGNIIAKGDFCSTTQAPGGCQDSFWFAATFAASAAKIVAPNQPACQGVPIGDGG